MRPAARSGAGRPGGALRAASATAVSNVAHVDRAVELADLVFGIARTREPREPVTAIRIASFEYAPEHADAFEELVRQLRATEEWSYVEREVDLRLSR